MSFILKPSSLLAASLAAVPVMSCEGNEKEITTSKSTTIASLPLYREKEEFDYYVDPPSKMVEAVRNVRLQAEEFKKSIQPQLDRVSNVYQTGKAHTSEAVAYIQDDENKFSRLGVVAVGGLLGLIATRKGSFLKRMTYASITITGVGFLCYPEETKSVAKESVNYAMKGARIAYHFAVGARPTVGNQNGKAFEKMADMISDVGQYGFRLFRREPDSVSSLKEEKETVGETREEKGLISEKKEEKETIEQSPEIVESARELEEPVVKETEPFQKVDTISEVIETIEAPTSVAKEESVAKSEEVVQPEALETVDPALEKLLEGDPGQGLEEDKEMYTTRS